MPLNKLENFIKNTEGRILYVNPSDLDATDAIENQGNSLTKPFKTVQRALLEAARFSYLRGSDNDIIEKTTILLYPGEHVIDNRPGFAIKDVSGTATAVSPSGATTSAQTTLSLTTDSVFDLTQEDNILYKFIKSKGNMIQEIHSNDYRCIVEPIVRLSYLVGKRRHKHHALSYLF